MNPVRIFVTGTDTGVGKTEVSRQLAIDAVRQNRAVFAYKPIETGCAVGADGALIAADGERLADAAGSWQAGDDVTMFRFRLPAAPLVAGRAEQAIVDLTAIERQVRQHSDREVILVEGAGGWRVPITETEDMGSLAKRLGFPIVIVGRAGLGTINHTLLTIEAVERSACSLLAVVLSRLPTDDLDFAESNRSEISSRWRGRVLTWQLGEELLSRLVR